MFNINDIPVERFVVVGSYALQTRKYADIDIVCYRQDISVPVNEEDPYMVSFYFNGTKIECLLADEQVGLQKFIKDLCGCGYQPKVIAPYLYQYILKAGHIHVPNRKWESHMRDYSFLRKLLIEDGVDLETPVVLNAIKQARKDTALVNKLGNIKLPRLTGITKDEFFDDGIQKLYDHDNIHKAIAHKDKPMYTFMQKDGDEVECQKSLWDNFPLEDKIFTVLEECYVISLERFIIPGVSDNRHVSFMTSLYKTCTTLTSGWFREFAINHYYEIAKKYDHGYVKKFEKNIKQYEDIKHNCISL